ncbi:MAG: ImmA/IrrE family metallo-endopeptidase, partial [Candidatus Nealsonbacteria bacterium]|nr:ImmA/IrrE family metallo-endopeptidase [Candidatus Nealsonbacteria bacterium]
FLSSPTEEKLPIPDCRTIGDTPINRTSPNLLESVQVMQRRQTWMRDFLIEEGQGPLKFVGSVKRPGTIEAVSSQIRSTLGLSKNWARKHPSWTAALDALRRAAEDAGILVAVNGIVGNNTHRKLDPQEFRGFVLSDEYAPLVFINNADFKSAQMFTMAHELAHLWIGRGGLFNLISMMPANDKIERFCNRVAAEFLIPGKDLKNCWADVEDSTDRFRRLARSFKVSPLVAARRALDLKLISRDAFFVFYNRYREEEHGLTAAKKRGGNFYHNQNVRLGRRFASAVVRAAREGRLLYRDAYQLTGLNGKTFDCYAEILMGRVSE